MSAELFANLAETTLNSAYTSGGSSIVVVSASGFPTTGTFRVRLGNTAKTIFRVDSVAGTTFTGAAEANDGNADGGDDVKIVASRAVAERFIQTPSAGEIAAYGGTSGASRYGPIWGVSPVIGADFAWVNQGTATVADASGVSYLVAPNATQNVRLRKKAMPGTPFTITVLVLPDHTTAANSELGLMLRESGTDKLVAVCVRDQLSLSVQRWTGVAAIGVTVFNRTVGHRDSVWLRVTHDGTNIISSYSFDGVNFVQIDTHVKTASFTVDANEVGYFVNNRSSGVAIAMSVLSWVQG